jgi:hypothetical protein
MKIIELLRNRTRPGHWLVFAFLGLYLGAFSSCNGEDTPACFRNEGKIIREEVSLPEFDKITVFEGVELILIPGPEQRVEIETGEFLRKEISAVVEGDRLILRNGISCNLFREYGITKIYVTTPDLQEIRSSTGFPIRSEGQLQFSNVLLTSESFLDPEAVTTDGSFDLDINAESVRIIVNGIAYFQLKGSADNLDILIAAGDSRIEAEPLIAENVIVDHRGSNDVRINPQQSLTGIIRGTGDVISVNRPDSVDVEIIFRGQLLFED